MKMKKGKDKDRREREEMMITMMTEEETRTNQKTPMR